MPTVAGLDVSYARDSPRAVGAAVVLDVATPAVLDQAVFAGADAQSARSRREGAWGHALGPVAAQGKALGAEGAGEEFLAAVGAGLGEDRLQVVLHRVLGEEHAPGDITGHDAGSQVVQQLRLSRA